MMKILIQLYTEEVLQPYFKSTKHILTGKESDNVESGTVDQFPRYGEAI